MGVDLFEVEVELFGTHFGGGVEGEGEDLVGCCFVLVMVVVGEFLGMTSPMEIGASCLPIISRRSKNSLVLVKWTWISVQRGCVLCLWVVIDSA